MDIYSFGMCALEVSVEHGLWDRDDESLRKERTLERLWPMGVFVTFRKQNLS